MATKAQTIAAITSAEQALNNWKTTMQGVGGVGRSWASIPKTLNNFEFDKSQLDLVGQQRAIREAKAQMKLTRKQLGYVEWKVLSKMPSSIQRSKNDSLKLLEDAISARKTQSIINNAQQNTAKSNKSAQEQEATKADIDRFGALLDKAQSGTSLTNSEMSELTELSETVADAANATMSDMNQALSLAFQMESTIQTMVMWIYLPTDCLSVNDNIINVPEELGLVATTIPYLYQLNISVTEDDNSDKVILVIYTEGSGTSLVYHCKMVYSNDALSEEKAKPEFFTAFTIALLGETTITQVAHGGVFFKGTGDGGGDSYVDISCHRIENREVLFNYYNTGGISLVAQDHQITNNFTGCIALRITRSVTSGTDGAVSYSAEIAEYSGSSEVAGFTSMQSAQNSNLGQYIKPLYLMKNGIVVLDMRNAADFGMLEAFGVTNS